MTATEYAVYDVCRAMASRHEGIVFFSGPKIANKFRSMSRNTPYTALKSLEGSGWFVLTKAPGRRADGTRTPTHYRVLTHEEWCASHPDSCLDNSEDWQTSLSQLEGRQSKPQCNQSKPECRPSQPEVTNLYKTPIQTTHASTESPAPQSQLEGMDTIPSLLDGANIASASNGRGEPYPQNWTVGSVVGIVMSDLDISGDANLKSWKSTVEKLLAKDHDPRLIVDVLRFYIDVYGISHVRLEGAEGFVTSFWWLLRDMTAKQVEELEIV